MARGKAQTAPAETPILAEDEPDLTHYADKPPTAKMVDFHIWAQEALGVKLDQKSLALGPTLYHYFQASAFNKAQTAARRAEKSAANGADEPAEETPKPRRGRPAAAKTEDEPAKPRRGRPAGSGAKPATTGTKPATGRGRGRRPAASGAAPF